MSERWRRRTEVSEQCTCMETVVLNTNGVVYVTNHQFITIISIRVLKLHIVHRKKGGFEVRTNGQTFNKNCVILQ